MTPTERELEFVRKAFFEIAERTAQWGYKIATWLIIGSAAALLVLLNIANEGRYPSEALRMPVYLYAASLSLAFFAATIGYFTSGITLRLFFQVSQLLSSMNSIEHRILSQDTMDQEEKQALIDHHGTIMENIISHNKRYTKNLILVIVTYSAFLISAVTFVTATIVTINSLSAY